MIKKLNKDNVGIVVYQKTEKSVSVQFFVNGDLIEEKRKSNNAFQKVKFFAVWKISENKYITFILEKISDDFYTNKNKNDLIVISNEETETQKGSQVKHLSVKYGRKFLPKNW